MISTVLEEASTQHPFVDPGEGVKKAGEGKYPFAEPSTAYERGWWDELRRQAQDGTPARRGDAANRLRRWAPLVRLMTPDERQAFHDQRLGMASRFTWDLEGARGESERDEAERRLHDFWKSTLKGRVA